MLYSHEGKYPAPLPERIRLEDGSTRTDSSTFTDTELEAWGYIGPITRPYVDPAIGECVWNYESQSYEVKEYSPADLAAKALQAAQLDVNFHILYERLLGSNSYQTIREQAKLQLDITVCCTELVAALLEAKLGRPNFGVLETTIQNVLTAATIDETEATEIYQILKDSKLLYAVNIEALAGFQPTSSGK